jgi:hypothetical protein
VQHLLLGAKKAVLVAAAVADAKIALGCAQGAEDLVGLGQGKADRLFDQDRLAELQSLQNRLGMCNCSGVETMTAVTSGWPIASSLLPV